MAHGKMKSVYGIYKKHGRDQFLDAAGYYSCHVHPESIDKTIDEMESRWYDATHRQTEAEKMVEDYNNGLTVLNDASLAYLQIGDEAYVEHKLKNTLEQHDTLDSFDSELTNKTVKLIKLAENGSVSIILINDQEIRKEQTDHANSNPSDAT
ncbi:MAG: hypothetical protein ACLSDS_02910 [Oscillospiraceae bacterium]